MTATHKFEVLDLTLHAKNSLSGFGLGTWNLLAKTNLAELDNWLKHHTIIYNIAVDDMRVNPTLIKGTIYLLIPDSKHAAHFKLVWYSIFPKVLEVNT
jgi:hypothetical protein